MGRLPRAFRVLAACVCFAGLLPHALAEEDPYAPLQIAYLRAVAPGEQAELYRDLFVTILQRVQRSYATDVDLDAFIAAAMKELRPLPPGTGDPSAVFTRSINAALQTLDPYSRYLDAKSLAGERTQSSGSFVGIGIELEAKDGAVRIVGATPGGPAARAGLQAGDVIVRLDEQPLAGVALPEAISRIRGEAGTSLLVTVRRGTAADELTFSVTRDTIRRQVVRWNMEGDVLVLRLSTFSGAVTAMIERAVAEAQAAHTVRAVVLDLRGNPGGLLHEAVFTADAFLAKGEIVSLRGRTPSNQRSWQADAAQLLPGAPMVVLVDGRSASASELVAAALQENHRAIVMGQRSYGKGSVQTTFPLGFEKGALKLTTAQYYGPSGKVVQKTGIAPDVELVTSDEAIDASRMDMRRCVLPGSAVEPAVACAVNYLQAGGAAASAALSTAAP